MSPRRSTAPNSAPRQRICLTVWERWAVSRVPTAPLRTSKGLVAYAKVVSVYDGDAVSAVFRHPGERFHTVKVRVRGIDAPELHPSRDTPCRDLHARAGAAARRRLLELAPVGSVVVLECFGEDKYGRTLADVLVRPRRRSFCGWICRKKRVSAGQQLLEEGYALAYDGGAKAEFTEGFLVRAASRGGEPKVTVV